MHLPSTPSLGQLGLPTNPRPDLGPLAKATGAAHGANALAWLKDQFDRQQQRYLCNLNP